MSLAKLKVSIQYLLPKHALSRIVGKFASSRCGPLTTAFTKWFIRQYKVDMNESLLERAEDFDRFNDFFTRELKPGLRPISDAPNTLVQPVDGRVSQLGPITAGRLVQAKKHDFSLIELLGGSEHDAENFYGGDFTTIYLSPKDYHRIHMPVDGVLRRMIYVPGDLFSVNAATTEHVPNLFARNERVVTLFDTPHGPMAMVLVGATIVASIETVWAGTITPPTGDKVFAWNYPEEGEEQIALKKGDEMGRFKLGSTVVACFGPDMLESFSDGFGPDAITRLGRPMATAKQD